MKTLVIYDGEGYVLQQLTGNYRKPIGVPYLEVHIPEGKRITSGVGVNVAVNPHHVFLEPIKDYEIEKIKKQLEVIQEALDFLIVGGA